MISICDEHCYWKLSEVILYDIKFWRIATDLIRESPKVYYVQHEWYCQSIFTYRIKTIS